MLRRLEPVNLIYSVASKGKCNSRSEDTSPTNFLRRCNSDYIDFFSVFLLHILENLKRPAKQGLASCPRNVFALISQFITQDKKEYLVTICG